MNATDRTSQADLRTPTEKVLERLHNVKKLADGSYKGCFSAHPDKHPSLHITTADDGKVLLKCHAGCRVEDIVRNIGLTMSDLSPNGHTSKKFHNNFHKFNMNGHKTKGKKSAPKDSGKVYETAKEAINKLAYAISKNEDEQKRGKLVKTWPYRNAKNELYAFVLRFNFPDGSKDFKPVSKYPEGWRIKDPPGKGKVWLPYCLEDARRRPTETIFWLEGEGCADAVTDIGLLGMTSAHGAKAARKTDYSDLAGRDVVLMRDMDFAGECYVADVGIELTNLNPPARARFLELPMLNEGEDVVDFIARRREDGKEDSEIRREIEDLAKLQPYQEIKPKEQSSQANPPNENDCENTNHDNNDAGQHEEEDDKPSGPLLTEMGNGERLIRDHGEDLRYCSAWRSWMAWAKTHWLTDGNRGNLEAEARAKQTVRDMFAAAMRDISRIQQAALSGNKTRKEANEETESVADLVKWALKSQEAKGIFAMLKMARSEPGVTISHDDLDRDAFLFNVRNGTLDLQTGKLRPHDRRDYISKIANVTFDSNAKCPLWRKFLARVVPKQQLRDYLQRAAGYGMSGSAREHCLFFLHGGGRNGKSVFLGTLLHIFGDYALQTIPELLIKRRSEAHPTERADLFRRRFVTTIETEDGKELAEALTKHLTGGDKIRARRMKQDFWDFDPTHKIFLAANHRPKIRGTDWAIWSRVKMIPFTVTISEDEKDPDLMEKLIAEGPGILNWVLEGCLAWQRDGRLIEPEIVRLATAEYRADEDVVGAFITERCIENPDVRERAATLYETFVSWSESVGEKVVLTKNGFGHELQRRGYERFTSNGTWYKGIAIIQHKQEDERNLGTI